MFGAVCGGVDECWKCATHASSFWCGFIFVDVKAAKTNSSKPGITSEVSGRPQSLLFLAFVCVEPPSAHSAATSRKFTGEHPSGVECFVVSFLLVKFGDSRFCISNPFIICREGVAVWWRLTWYAVVGRPAKSSDTYYSALACCAIH